MCYYRSQVQAAAALWPGHPEPPKQVCRRSPEAYYEMLRPTNWRWTANTLQSHLSSKTLRGSPWRRNSPHAALLAVPAFLVGFCCQPYMVRHATPALVNAGDFIYPLPLLLWVKTLPLPCTNSWATIQPRLKYLWILTAIHKWVTRDAT